MLHFTNRLTSPFSRSHSIKTAQGHPCLSHSTSSAPTQGPLALSVLTVQTPANPLPNPTETAPLQLLLATTALDAGAEI